MELLVPALEEIAPTEVRQIWFEAMREISPDPLPIDYQQRRELIMSRYDQIEERLDELSSAFFRCSWRLDVASNLYAIEHRDEMQTGSRK